MKLFAVESGAKWVVTQKCLMRAEFGAVGAIIPNGAALSLLASGGEVQVDAVGAQAITLEGFGMYGAQKQETRRVFLDFLAADPGRLRFEIDLAVVSYNKDQPSLGLQYFRAVQEFSGSFGFQRLHYPLFSTPTAGGGSALQLAASLDLREPAPGHVPRAMLRSEVRVRKVVTHGVQQAAVALNKFAADGTRLFATAKSVSETLAFHFASAPTEMESATSVPRYDGLVLLPHGSVEINSASGALLGSSLLERVSEFRTLGFNLEHPADALDATMWFTDPKKNRKTSDTEGNPRAYLSRYAITSAAEYGAALSPQIKFSPDRLALYALGGRAGAYRAIQCGVPSRLPIAPLDFEASGGTTEERSRFDATVIARHRALGRRGHRARFLTSNLRSDATRGVVHYAARLQGDGCGSVVVRGGVRPRRQMAHCAGLWLRPRRSQDIAASLPREGNLYCRAPPSGCTAGFHTQPDA